MTLKVVCSSRTRSSPHCSRIADGTKGSVSSWIPTPYILALLRQVALEPWALYNRGVCYVPESVGVTSGQSWIPTSGLPSAPWVGYTPWAYSPAASRLDLLGNGRISDSCWTPPFMIAVSSPHAGMCTSNGCSDIACLHISHWYSHLPWRRRRNSPLCVRVHWLAPTLLAFLWASGFSFVWAWLSFPARVPVTRFS